MRYIILCHAVSCYIMLYHIIIMLYHVIYIYICRSALHRNPNFVAFPMFNAFRGAAVQETSPHPAAEVFSTAHHGVLVAPRRHKAPPGWRPKAVSAKM